MFGGDAMLGRLVNDAIGLHGPGYPLGAIAPLLRTADLAIVNLECAITASTRQWHGEPKAFYFGAPPQAIESLTGAGIDLVSLANNHALDFDVRGLLDTVDALDAHSIAHAGAGADLQAALRPVIVERNGLRIGMAAFCDHQEDFAAGPARPGIAWLDLRDEPAALAAFSRALDALARADVDWPILSLHWGPNMAWRPSPRFRRLAHAAIDMGWKILFGHSAHVFQGIEWRNGAPIMYAAGDLVDDYYVDPTFCNDHQLLFELQLGPDKVERIVLHPLFIADCRTIRADSAQRAWIFRQMSELCAELGTPVHPDAHTLVIAPPA
ncbi:CapA family protein [Massilia horti]|uniref:CapA family protein n=1 Tax=Massilia horti TaxID=2562153 RepID=UPI0014320FF2|nr:CapA family protein [Massilia horti]